MFRPNGTKKLFRVIAAGYAIGFLTVSLVIFVSYWREGKQIAETVGSSLRNSLLIRDYREVAYRLNPLVGVVFQRVNVVDENGNTLVELSDDRKTPDRLVSRIFTYQHRQDVYAGSYRTGAIIFFIDLKGTIPTILAGWLLALIVSIPIMRRYLKSYERHRLAELKAKEREMLVSIAKQVSHDIRSPLTALNMLQVT